ncbi:upstream-binding factor 1-like protein 1 [Castor canadensis]|uniref:upstream-binding factor 1-like protein 1 n=1 Tax=Castor canadensis TaxID=51338 RepID=UPI003D1866FF
MASLHNQGYWSRNDILRLMERMEKNLPPDDSQAFKTTQACLDWGKVAFNRFSGEMCKLKWLEISHKLRKYRTLTELVVEAKERVADPYRSKGYKKHPDYPKRPLTAYIRFYKDKWAQYSQMYPKLNNQELTKVLSEKYKQLPEDIKQMYIQDFQKEKQDYEEKVAQFKEDHPHLVQNSKKSGVLKRHQTKAPKELKGNVSNVKPGLETDELSMEVKFPGEPKKPPMNAYHKFHEESWASRELQHLPLRERMVEISRRWQRVPQSRKDSYKSQAEELQRQYWVDLDLWLKTLSPEEYAAYREAKAAYGKRKNWNVTSGPNPKCQRRDVRPPNDKGLQEGLGEERGLQPPGADLSETLQVQSDGSQGSKGTVQEDVEEDKGSSSSDSSSGGEDQERDPKDSDSSSSSSGNSSDLDSV